MAARAPSGGDRVRARAVGRSRFKANVLRARDVISAAGVLLEVARCAPGRIVVLTRVGNRAVMPNEGNERTLEEYISRDRWPWTIG
ncbi:MAG TPA: hypothetical protein VMG60_22595 [Burkholderiaceae bacterium]|nr:hypothetical protein [Burkholderiaceae bacterium]